MDYGQNQAISVYTHKNIVLKGFLFYKANDNTDFSMNVMIYLDNDSDKKIYEKTYLTSSLDIDEEMKSYIVELDQRLFVEQENYFDIVVRVDSLN